MDMLLCLSLKVVIQKEPPQIELSLAVGDKFYKQKLQVIMILARALRREKEETMSR